MKYFVVPMGISFESAKRLYGNKFFVSLEEAKECAILTLEAGRKFFICDENGGVFLISRVPQIVGNS